MLPYQINCPSCNGICDERDLMMHGMCFKCCEKSEAYGRFYLRYHGHMSETFQYVVGIFDNKVGVLI